MLKDLGEVRRGFGGRIEVSNLLLDFFPSKKVELDVETRYLFSFLLLEKLFFLEKHFADIL